MQIRLFLTFKIGPDKKNLNLIQNVALKSIKKLGKMAGGSALNCAELNV